MINEESNLIKEREHEESFRPFVKATEKIPEKFIDALEQEKRPPPFDFFFGKDKDKYFNISQDTKSFRLGYSEIKTNEELFHYFGIFYQRTYNGTSNKGGTELWRQPFRSLRQSLKIM